MTRAAAPALAASPTVLLLVDFINPLDFDGAEALAPSALIAARATARLRRQAARSGVQTLYANDNYGRWRSDFKAVWTRCHAMRGAAGDIARLMKPRRDDLTILKPRHSAFYATPLDLLLRQLKCKRLVITGLAADNCVLFTAMDAYVHGYSLWVPPDCTAAESEEAKHSALQHMRRVLKASVRASTGV
ncbi:MAG TPA: isochorismatase family cysteine hydrolase [Burkholderiaceae bacterium]|nr:isochorismatase family cysteine hydrolase [Burkholderiaceae bacterium]